MKKFMLILSTMAILFIVIVLTIMLATDFQMLLAFIIVCIALFLLVKLLTVLKELFA